MAQLISYYGGKQKLASKIIPLIPKHTVYVEPFCGGATIFFNKPMPKITNSDHYSSVINDHNDYIISLYREARDNPDEFFGRLELTPYSRSEHAKALEIYRNQENYNQSDKAWSAYVNANMSFSKVLGGGWGMAKYGRDSASTFKKQRMNRDILLKLEADTHIECRDALKVIKQWDSPQTFFYCDPPYPNTGQGHYSGYTLDDYQRLIDTLDNSVGSFLLSCYPNAAKIPDHWEVFKFQTSMSASINKTIPKKREELVFRRFNTVSVRKEIQKLYDSGQFDCFVDPTIEDIF